MTRDAAPAGRIDCGREGNLAFVTVDNPAKHNALTVAMWHALRATMGTLAKDPECRCIVFRGAGTSLFVSGADISEFTTERSNREQVTRYNEEYVWPTLAAILECPIPTIAMIAGPCMGGGFEIASVCDFRIACDNATFGAPTQRMGFPLGFAETELVFKLYGRNVAAELLIAGQIYSAARARETGIVQNVVAPQELEAKVRSLAAQIAGYSPAAVRENKAQLLRLLKDWSPVTPAERIASYSFADSNDYQEGYRAFLAKTKPVFKGK